MVQLRRGTPTTHEPGRPATPCDGKAVPIRWYRSWFSCARLRIRRWRRFRHPRGTGDVIGSSSGIDSDAAQVEAATCRFNDLSLSNVKFETADLSSPPDGVFDAIVGRLVLMYQPGPEAVIRTLADRLESGSVMAFIEYDLDPPDSPIMWPRSPITDQLVHWVDEAWEVLGNQTRMGTRLPSLLRSAGLEPQLPYELTGGVLTGADGIAIS